MEVDADHGVLGNDFLGAWCGGLRCGRLWSGGRDRVVESGVYVDIVVQILVLVRVTEPPTLKNTNNERKSTIRPDSGHACVFISTFYLVSLTPL